MKRTIIIIIALVILAGLILGAYYLFTQKNNPTTENPLNSQTGTLPNINNSSTVSSSNTVTNSPTSTQLAIGTAQGTVEVNNFYLSNPPVDDGGDVVIKQNQNYVIVYDPTNSSFWLGISGSPFATWESAAEQDFLATLGVASSDACKLDITSGVIYSPGNALDGEILPTHFCPADGVFQSP